MPHGRATSESQIHHVTAIFLSKAAIVIDVNAQNSVFRVPLNGCVIFHKDLPVEGTMPSGFQYVYLPGKVGKHLLVQPNCWNWIH